jgi:biopolymer transport protein ExbD
MIRRNHKPKDEDFTSLEITPLVDVVFLLLIFFLLTAVFVQPGIDIDLPEADTGRMQDHENPYTVEIARDGTFTLNKIPATLPDIEGIPRDSDVLILEDKKGPYGVFVEILDALRKTGIDRISIVTDEKAD